MYRYWKEFNFRYNRVCNNPINMFLIITTYPANPKEVKQFTYELIGSKLAKCINRINYVKSTFFWEGKIKNEKEVILLIKVKKENKEKLVKFIEAKHPYATPEILIFSPEEVSQKYLEWIQK